MSRPAVPAAALLVLAACAASEPADVPLEVRFELDETAFTAPEAPQYTVPFDLVTADMDLDGDPDLLVNWHNLARLELFENRDGAFVLRNPAGDDDTGLYDNPGVPDLYAPDDDMLPRAREAGPGVYVWHEPDRRGDWRFRVAPADGPVTLSLRANRPLTARIGERFVRRRDETSVDLVFDAPRELRVNVAFVATQLVIVSSVPVHAGADLTPLGTGVELWKSDPHGIAWVDVLGTAQPDIFVTRGGLEGNLQPPHDPKVDGLFVYDGGEPLYLDRRDALPPGYGRGRRIEWVDVDGDSINELYVGNTATPNALLAAGGDGRYVDVAPALGLDAVTGDTFAWLDVDDDGRDDLVFIEEGGFTIAYNRGDRVFERAAGAAVGLRFPAGSEPVSDELFISLSLHVLDADNDGRLDLWLAGHGEGRRHALYLKGDDGFRDATTEAGLDAAPLANRVVFLDVDNDGRIDVLTLGTEAAWLRNHGGRFRVEPADPTWGLREFVHAAPVDVDGDGHVDVALVGHRRLLARNRTRGGGEALSVLPTAPGNDPVGTVVVAHYADGTARAQRYGSTHTTRYSQGLAPLHFGLPAPGAIERLEVRWPDGRRESRAVDRGERFIELGQ